MSEEKPLDTAHVFDQTNGLLGEAGETKQPSESSERDRRRQGSIAQGLGYISTGHN